MFKSVDISFNKFNVLFFFFHQKFKCFSHVSEDIKSEMAIMSKNITATKNASEEADSAEEQEMFEKVGPKATLYFSHSEAVLPFLSLLGLNKDDYALTHSNYEEAKER